MSSNADSTSLDESHADLLALVESSLARKRAEATAPKNLHVRRIRDTIFSTIETCKRQAQLVVKTSEIPIDAQVKDDVTDQSDIEGINVPAASAIGVLAAAEVAFHWNELSNEADIERFRSQATTRLVGDAVEAQFQGAKLIQKPDWELAALAFIADSMNRSGEAVDMIHNGLPPHILQSNGSFSIEADNDPVQQIGAIVRGTLERLHKLCDEDHRAVRTEIAGWEKWKHKLIVPTEKDIPRLESTYKSVRIPYEWYRNLVSSDAEVRQTGLDAIRQYGGFIHEPKKADYEEMLQGGVLRMTDDGSAYYGLITDRTLVQQHLSQMCGYNPTKKYKSTRDLPKRSKLGWSIDWSDERYALEMLQCPYNVALSVEVAVQKETDSNAGKSKRNAGLAAALKDNVYRSIDLPWILTRHFQIMEVNIPGSGRKKQEISGANNVGSDTFIRMLGGREIGSAYERSTIKAHDANGTEHDVELLIRWIFCLAPRKTSLEVIEGRANRM
jgi:hypothetical protein